MQSDISPEESLNLPELSNDVPTELHRVQRALVAVFSPNNALLDRRHVANQYLTMIQHELVAWMVAIKCSRLTTAVPH